MPRISYLSPIQQGKEYILAGEIAFETREQLEEYRKRNHERVGNFEVLLFAKRAGLKDYRGKPRHELVFELKRDVTDGGQAEREMIRREAGEAVKQLGVREGLGCWR